MTEDPADEQLPGDEVEGFRIEDEARATWALGRIAATTAALAVAKETAAEYVKAATKEAERAREFFEPHLESYFQDNPPKKGKSTKLASGTLGYRTAKGGIRIIDQVMLVEWAAETDPTMILTVTKRTVAAAEAKAHYRATGEIPAGCDLTEDSENFYAKAKT